MSTAPPHEPDWVADVLGFWFDELAPDDWWRGDPATDARVRARFASLHERIVRGPADAATLDAPAHLALVLVLDQFSRHLYRDTARAFATDARALALTDDAIARRLDAALDETRRQFLYMPLMHAEDAASQDRSLALFAGFEDRAARRAAAIHHATIARFGRFPARNAALGRTSTADELAYLAREDRGRKPKNPRDVSPSA